MAISDATETQLEEMRQAGKIAKFYWAEDAQLWQVQLCHWVGAGWVYSWVEYGRPVDDMPVISRQEPLLLKPKQTTDDMPAILGTHEEQLPLI